MIKRDYMKEIENSLKLVREQVEEGIIFKSPEKAFLTINKELKGLVGLDIETVCFGIAEQLDLYIFITV
jgi:hypothetical protein